VTDTSSFRTLQAQGALEIKRGLPAEIAGFIEKTKRKSPQRTGRREGGPGTNTTRATKRARRMSERRKSREVEIPQVGEWCSDVAKVVNRTIPKIPRPEEADKNKQPQRQTPRGRSKDTTPAVGTRRDTATDATNNTSKRIFDGSRTPGKKRSQDR